MALKDDPKVQELIAKASAAESKKAVKLATNSVKSSFAGLLEGEEDKATIKTLKAAQKQVLADLKNI